MDPLTGLLSMFGSLGSSFMNQQFNQTSAQNMMNFQEQMSSTSWQRGVADMKAAGINPILAASHGGASAPSGAMPGQSPISDPITPAISTAINARNAEFDQQKKVQEINNLASTDKQIRATTDNIAQSTLKKAQDIVLDSPDTDRARLDHKVLQSTAVQMAREAATATGEVSRGIGSLKDAINPFVRSTARSPGVRWTTPSSPALGSNS